MYCGVRINSVIPYNYPNLLKSQGHVNNFLKSQCTISIINRTLYEKG